MARPLTKAERLAVEARACELAASGWTQARIAGELGVDQGTVSRALTRASAGPAPALDAATRARAGALLDQLAEVLGVGDRPRRADGPESLAAARRGLVALKALLLAGGDEAVPS